MTTSQTTRFYGQHSAGKIRETFRDLRNLQADPSVYRAQLRHPAGAGADAADAEIRMIFSEALPLLKAGRYGTMFEDLQLTAAGDGLGLALVGGGAR